MSQQGPGGYGGGGPYGPPGGGGGYGGPPAGGGGGGYPPPGGAPPGGGYPPPGGAPPGGYGGPPGYGPPAGGPPGYGPPQQNYGGYPGGPGGPPPKKSKALLFVGLGCGVLILLGIAGSVVSYFFMKSKMEDAQSAIANFGADSGVLAAPAPGSVSATCAKTIACCKAITGKSAGPSNTALVDQACNGIGLLSDAQCLQQYNALKPSAAAVHVSCE